MYTDTVAHPAIQVTSRRLAARTVVAIEGELDIASAAALREKLFAEFRRARAAVVLDLSGVSFCDAAGLSVLVAARRRARLLGLSLSLAAPRPSMSRLLQITGLQRSFDVCPTAGATA
ncbi:anti-sigma B factor antagonist [Thermomonospora echinospora]|uniref:Anti-sigma factor antagonist n=1 Tax=Thermomonospora echinospora TaxID=1992 RepID=A0A1H6CJQ0_9ACTN|nr:STAS domain-containing protein [Thermomonospora echinospora]SEG73148.1 anti-sigma B factor antagonist [Thermomonospora echinospora]